MRGVAPLFLDVISTSPCDEARVRTMGDCLARAQATLRALEAAGTAAQHTELKWLVVVVVLVEICAGLTALWWFRKRAPGRLPTWVVAALLGVMVVGMVAARAIVNQPRFDLAGRSAETQECFAAANASYEVCVEELPKKRVERERHPSSPFEPKPGTSSSGRKNTPPCDPGDPMCVDW